MNNLVDISSKKNRRHLRIKIMKRKAKLFYKNNERDIKDATIGAVVAIVIVAPPTIIYLWKKNVELEKELQEAYTYIRNYYPNP